MTLGLVKNETELNELFLALDQDRSGQIEFDEFISLVHGEDDRKAEIRNFFRKFMKHNLVNDSEEMPAQLIISAYRRKQMIKGMFS